jgi:protein-S-isoprenylcysteine O-methyltransferase Ste14
MASDYVLLVAQGLAIAALIRFAFYFADEIARGETAVGPQPIGNPIVDALFYLHPLLLSAAAFVISWNKPSLLVITVLVAAGVLMIIEGIAETKNLTIVALPSGPFMGFLSGFAVLSMGIVKIVTTAKTIRAAKATTLS